MWNPLVVSPLAVSLKSMMPWSQTSQSWRGTDWLMPAGTRRAGTAKLVWRPAGGGTVNPGGGLAGAAGRARAAASTLAVVRDLIMRASSFGAIVCAHIGCGAVVEHLAVLAGTTVAICAAFVIAWQWPC